MLAAVTLALALQVTGAAPVAAPTVAAPAVDWRTAPFASGRWRYRAIVGGSEAVWSDVAEVTQLRLTCTLATRQVTITRTNGGRPMTVFTTGVQRLVVEPTLSAFDPLLDQMAFSRGRFAIAAPGAALLVLPSFAEPARTIEDCRK